MYNLFFELLRVSLGTQQTLTVAPTEEQWNFIYKTAVKQTVAGVAFSAIEKLPREQRPDRKVLMPWYMKVEKIAEKNRLLNCRTKQTIDFFKENGFDCCILKGQGLALLYPNPLQRNPGDIDIWLGGGRRKIYDFARSRVGLKGLNYKHIHYPLYEDVEVEVHITPDMLFSPLENHRLRHFFDECADVQFHNRVTLPNGEGDISVPTDEFNRVYVLLHIYRHLFYEGIGLRQVLDYYYLLRQPTTQESRKRTLETLGKLKMLKFLRAMMWVQREILGLEEKYLLIEPDEKEGKFLLDEIMMAGNFGKYDIRIDRSSHDRLIPRVWNSMKRNWKFVKHYPYEMIWDVPFHFWQFVWRRLQH